MLLVGMVPSMAQEKMSEEKALMQQYYDLLFQKKDTVKANKTKAKLLKKYPKSGVIKSVKDNSNRDHLRNIKVVLV